MAIIEAHLARANILCDAHLRVSSQTIPKIFRNGLYYESEIDIDTKNDTRIEQNQAEVDLNKIDKDESIEDPDQPKEENAKGNPIDDDWQDKSTKTMVKNVSDIDLQVYIFHKSIS